MTFSEMVLALLRGEPIVEAEYNIQYGCKFSIVGLDESAVTVWDGDADYSPATLAPAVASIGDGSPDGRPLHGNGVCDYALSVVACARWVRRVSRHMPRGHLAVDRASPWETPAAELLRGVVRLIEAWQDVALAEGYAHGRSATDEPAWLAPPAPWSAEQATGPAAAAAA